MKNVDANLTDKLVELNFLKSPVAKFKYWTINKLVKDRPDMSFMNYGYAPLDGKRIFLESKDEVNRLYVQLYHRVASAIDLRGLDVLEISCGRGGGATYIKQYFRPRRMCALDLAPRGIAFCNKQHASEGLCFVRGDAQALAFGDGTFDAVVNIEASHDYPDVNKFFTEVRRVLKPGGYFLYADFRWRQHGDRWRDQVARSGLTIVEEEDITANVAKGLELNTAYSKYLIRKLFPRILWPILSQLFGTKGSIMHKRFDSGKECYRRYVLRKEEEDVRHSPG